MNRLVALYVMYACAVMPDAARDELKLEMIRTAKEVLITDIDDKKLVFNLNDQEWAQMAGLL